MAEALFATIHLAVVGLVVVTHQVEDTVENQDAHLVAKRAAEAARIALGHGWGDGNIPEIFFRSAI